MSQVNLSWTAATPQPGTSIVKYIIYRQNQGNWPPVGTSLTNSFSDSTVADLTTYSYYVVAIDSRGAVSSQSNQVTVTTLGPLASVPTGLLVSGVTTSSASLSWNASTGASSYNIYRNGTKVLTTTSTAGTDTGLSSSTVYTYTVTAVNAAGESAQSTAVTATTNPVSQGSRIVFDPGIFVRVGGYSSMQSLASLSSALDPIFAADPNGRIKGVSISPTMAQLEGPTLGQYDGFGAENGFTKIGAIINYLKSKSPPRKLTILLNGGGNGYSTSSVQNPAFMSNFCPAYMNAGAKGSPTDQYGGGEVHQSSSGVPLDRPYLVIWNANVCARITALVKAYMTQFGPDTATGGIYRWDLYQEISVNTSAPGYSTSALLATWPAFMAGARAAAPTTLIMMKPTFINPNDGSAYPQILQAMYNNHISLGTEDCTPARVDWGQKGYFGQWASTPLDHRIANGGNPDWDLHQNVDGAELFFDRDSTKWNTPGATLGTGRIYDQTGLSPPFQGVWTQVNVSKASHVDVYVDCAGGPNVSRRVFSSSAPPNYTPGPGAGLVAAHPNLIDVLAGNTSYPGVLDQGCAMAYTGYPSSYPT